MKEVKKPSKEFWVRTTSPLRVLPLLMFFQIPCAIATPCRMEVVQFKKVLGFPDNPNRIHWEASRGCKKREQGTVEYQDVRLEVFEGNKLLAYFESDKAWSDDVSGDWIMSFLKTSNLSGVKFKKQPPFVVWNTRSGEVRAPGGLYIELKKVSRGKL